MIVVELRVKNRGLGAIQGDFTKKRLDFDARKPCYQSEVAPKFAVFQNLQGTPNG